MSQFEEVETVLKHDDIVTTLVIDTVMGFKRSKLSKFELPPLQEKSTLIDILNNLKTDSDTRVALGYIRSMGWLQPITDNMGKREIEELEGHLMKYLKGLKVDGGFKLQPETRYSMEGFRGAKVLATKSYSRGANIDELVGTICEVSQDQEEVLVARGIATSCMLKSARTNTVMVLIGVISFLNHRCEANCKLVKLSTKLVGLQATRRIKAGEELTIFYGRDYFRRENKVNITNKLNGSEYCKFLIVTILRLILKYSNFGKCPNKTLTFISSGMRVP